jgi:nucleotide-binding universal stress UspA family protein
VKRKERELLDASSGKLVVKNIMVPLDFSPSSDELLKVAVRKARIYNSKIHLVHVVHANLEHVLESAGISSILNFSKDIKPLIENKFKELMEGLSVSDIEFEIAIEEGSPAHTIVEYSQKNEIDIVIVGRKGLGKTSYLLGSVAQRLLHMTKCPVYVV